MSIENLEKLSKPVAYDYQIALACIADGHNENGKWVDWRTELSRDCPPDWMIEEGKVKDLKPRYSQEYVTVLREDAARWFNAFEKAVSAGARYEERIEALQQQAVKDGNRIAELEQQLQQPILLPRVAAIYANLSDVGRHRTSPENVRDVVDAIQAHADSKVKGAAE